MLSHRIKGGVDMKKQYEIPEMEMFQYERENIITTSPDGWDPDEDATEIIGL